MSIIYRTFHAKDADAVNAVALAAFMQFKNSYNDWESRKTNFTDTASLAASGEMIVAESDGRVVGAVTYVPPDPLAQSERAAYFDHRWAIVRMLVVDPSARGQGIGRALTEACINRAKRDAAPVIALHTSTMMTVAQPMYLRLGFALLKALPPIGGVPYGLYALALE